MKKNKTNKLFVWLTTSALAMCFGIAALPTPIEELQTSAATDGAVDGSGFFVDDFEKYSSYGSQGQIGGVRTTSGVGWTNQWFDGVGDGTYDQGCTSAYASIVNDGGNKVLYLNTNKNENSFFYLTPTKDGSPLVMKNYEISFRFKVLSSTKSEDDNRHAAAPWFGTLNRKTITGASSYEPGDGRYNGTNSLLMALRAGVKPTDASTVPNYFFSFSLKFMYDGTTDFVLLGEKKSNGTRADLDNVVKPSTIYGEWHTYKCVANEESFDMYMDGKHMGGAELGTGAGFNCVRGEGYISLALCVADIYVDDVNIREILPVPGVSGASSATMRADKKEDAVFTLVNTTTIISVKKGTEALSTAAYALSNGKLTIKQSYIDNLGVGTHTLTITASDGVNQETFEITLVITPTPGVLGGNNTVLVQVGNAASISLENVSGISSITKDGADIPTNVYSYASGTLNFTTAYISSLGLGTHEFVVNTTTNGEFTLVLNIKEKAAVDGSTMVQVTQGSSASFTLKNVSSISAVTYNNSVIDTNAYTYSDGVITFSGAYTSSLATGRQSHVIQTDAGDLTVTLYVRASTVTDTAVVNVINLINAIPTTVTRGNYTTAKSAYDNAKSAYDQLTATQQANVSNYSTLTSANTTITTFKTNMDSADAVDALIAAIPATVSTRSDYTSAKAAYDSAKTEYDNLNTNAQGLVTKTAALTSANNMLTTFAGKISQADNVEGLIGAIPSSIENYDGYTTAKAAYNTAKTAYDNLDTDVQGLVRNAGDFATAKAMLEAFEANLGEAATVMSKIDAIPTSVTTRGGYNSAVIAYNTAKEAYDGLTSDQQANVTNSGTLETAKNMLDSFKAKIDAADAVDAKIALIPTTVTTRDNYTTALDAYNTANVAYTQLDTVSQGLVTNATTLSNAGTTLASFKAKMDAADAVDSKIAAIPTSIEGSAAYNDAKTAYNAAKTAYDNLAADVQALVTKKNGLSAAKTMLDAYEANLGEAAAVMSKIEEIPTTITTRNGYISAQNLYTTAKVAYDGLNEEQRASVENASKLTDAKSMLDAFALKISAADEVDAKIALIPTSVISRSEYTTAKAAYDTANSAYSGLTADVQALVTKGSALNNANTMLTSFKADIDAADAVDAKIGAIATDTITADNYDARYAAVVEAERMYNDLSITAQELVTKSADLQARRSELTEYESTLGNSADGVITLIANIPANISTRGDYTSAKSAYDTALAAYEALDLTAQGEVTNSGTLVTAKNMLDTFAAKMVQADEVDVKIAAIPTTVTTREQYVASEAAYKVAKDAYDKLNIEVQGLVTKSAILTTVNNTLATFKTNMDGADALDSQLATLPTEIYSREEYATAKVAYDTAKTAYDKATSEVIALVTKGDALTVANDVLTTYKGKMDSADAVDAKIAAIPSSITTRGAYISAKEAYNEAKTAYEALATDVKVLVTKSATLATAKDALDTFAAKMASADAIDVLIEAIPSTVNSREEFTLAKNKYDNANDAYKSAKEDVQSLVTKTEILTTRNGMLVSFAERINAADAVDAKIEAIPTSVNSRTEYTAAKAAYDTAKAAYDNSDEKFLIVNGETLTSANNMLEIYAAKIAAADKVAETIAELPTEVTTRNGYTQTVAAYNGAKEAYDGLNADVKVLVENGTKLSVLKNALDEFATKITLADAVDTFINAIPATVTNKTEYESAKKAYDTANIAYANLEADVQALVTKSALLETSKNTLDTFAAKIEAADTVVALIAKLSTSINSTAEKAAMDTKCKEAEAAYAELDAEGRALVGIDNQEKLSAVRTAIDAYVEPVLNPSIDGETSISVKYEQDATFTLVNVTTVKSIFTNTVELEASNYTYANGKLSIKASYFQALGGGVYNFYVTVDGDKELDPIEVTYQPASVPTLDAAKMYEKSTDGDLTFTIENAQSVTKVVREKTVSTECYAFAENTLTVKGAYLKSLSGGEHTFNVTTDNGNVTVSVTITAEVTLQIVIPEDSTASFVTDEDGIEKFEEGKTDDVTFALKGINSRAIITLKIDENTRLSEEAYSYKNGTLTIKGAYVQTLKAGAKQLELVVTIPPKEDKPTDETNDKEEDAGGCGSTLGFASTVLTAAFVGGLALVRKKKED